MKQIPKSEILFEIRKTTQYIGAKTVVTGSETSGNGSTGATTFETIGAIEENEEILWRFVCESVTEIRSKAVKASATDVTAPEIEGLEESLRPYLIYATTYKWLMLGNVVNDRMPLYRELYGLHLGIVRQKVGSYERGGYVDPMEAGGFGGVDVPVSDKNEADISDEGEEDGNLGGVNVPVYESNGAEITDEGEEEASVGEGLPQWFGCQKGVYHKNKRHGCCG